jgi:hypothetical protein
VQGLLRKEYVSVTVDTSCAHCSRPMKIEIDSDLEIKVEDNDCEPIIFVPDVDFSTLEDENIINSF